VVLHFSFPTGRFKEIIQLRRGVGWALRGPFGDDTFDSCLTFALPRGDDAEDLHMLDTAPHYCLVLSIMGY